jgi:hypothetical protein
VRVAILLAVAAAAIGVVAIAAPRGQASDVFEDVPDSHWAHDNIGALYDAGITTGCATNPLRYCPNSPVTRAQMAAFILRVIGHDDHLPSYRGYFSDVSAGRWYTGYVEHLYEHGITTGCSATSYCPDDPGAAVLERLLCRCAARLLVRLVRRANVRPRNHDRMRHGPSALLSQRRRHPRSDGGFH